MNAPTPHTMTTHTPASPTGAAARQPRAVDLDVVRAVALIGVCVMNYHGYLNGVTATAVDGSPFWHRVFDPWSGPLETRFAATFVVVAGIGVSLLTRRALASCDRDEIAAVRWTLVRRGFLLLAVGYVLDWVWPGTILFFYGGYFVVGALLFTLGTRWLAAVGVAAALAAAALQWWGLGRDATWLFEGRSEFTQSPRDFLFDLFVRGTHPLLPWLAFLCLGMVLGRHPPRRTEDRLMLALGGIAAVALAYVLRGVLPWHEQLRSTRSHDRGLVYVLAAAGVAVTAVVVIGALARATAAAAAPLTRWLAVAGRTTLTLYIGHVLVFNTVVRVLHLVDEQSGLDAALLLALAYWVVAVAAAVAWSRVAAMGPLEWVYRRFSDPRSPVLRSTSAP